MNIYNPSNITCICCKGTNFTHLYQVSDTNQNVPGSWDIISCDSCKLGILWPQPNQPEVETFYKNSFYTEDGKRFLNLIEILRSIAGKLRGSMLNRLSNTKGKLLDYGSGAGHFARAQQREGWEVYTVDPYSSASQNSSTALIDNAGKLTLAYPDNFFDAISLWYVLEHLPYPHATISELIRTLKPGGIILIAVQDFSSIQARFFGNKWLILDPPRHIWQFCPANLDLLLGQFKFKRIALTRSSFEFGPFTILQSVLNQLTGNKNHLFRFLKNSGLSIEQNPRTSLPGLVASLALLPILLPLSITAYFTLLWCGSSDVFSAYYRKTSHE